ncbi:hypothetical protein PBI_SINATRA_50 [Microbacterium phage Sinatra]|uniref:Uncharacterized protein n=1 Tax=Microbacterium phage Sinatra TaxID=2591219 RepID=A0A514DGQ3_9CAUD|nr:hypothetical protein SEA_PHERBOT_50 [Microbacterium phage Pherbot]QCG77955.1 hypothetical protein SEA_BUSTLETON_50 [Microbacterium phage Bustleton]QDH92777.1 hypothetical protein PBI_SINATRA_50 [Microbacterium phage Sinatra]
MDIKQLLTNAITDQDSRGIHRLLNDAVELQVVTASVATKLGHLADVMYTGSYDVRTSAAAAALALVK